ncbi:MAG: argininosuccinate lyase [Pseudomonadota bacterium]
MTRSVFGAALVFAAFCVTPALAAKQDFELVNKTGYDISHVYVSPTKSNDWEEDVLGKDILEDGDSWDIEFERGDKTCKWDLKVVYADDNSAAYWRNIDLCTVEKITIRYNRKSDTTSATFD